MTTIEKVEGDRMNYDEQTIIGLFVADKVKTFRTVETSHGEDDFREAVFVETEDNGRLVIKVAGNAFTTPESVKMWQRCAEEYRKLGYYCPEIFASVEGDFPLVDYKGHRCVAYAEEFSKYESAENVKDTRYLSDDLYIMTARVAAEKFDYTDIPSGYTMFDLCPGDEMDEVTMNAQDFREYCETLPECFREQTDRMFQRWEENRRKLREMYFKLPFSVFQADFNKTNVLIDSDGKFVGIYDFNLAGRDEFLNYLFREILGRTMEEELAEILRALRIVSGYYAFSDEEIAAAPLIYRCVKPLWFCPVDDLKNLGSDMTAIQKQLDEMEYAQVREIDFASAMRKNGITR